MLKSQMKITSGLLCLGLAVSVGCSKGGNDGNNAAQVKAQQDKAAQAQKAADDAKAKSDETTKALAAKILEQEELASNLENQIKQAEEEKQKAKAAADEAASQAAAAQTSQEEAAKIKAASDLKSQNADTLIAQLDSRKAQAESVEKAAEEKIKAVEDLQLNTKTEMDKVYAGVANGQASPVLVVGWADSAEDLRNLRNKLAEADSSGQFSDHIKEYENKKHIGVYLLSINSVTEFDKTWNSIQEDPKLTVVPFAVQTGRIKTYVNLTFSKDKANKTYYIGESSDFPVTAESIKKATAGSDVSLFTSDFKDCTYVSVDCLKSLVAQGYLSDEAAPNSRNLLAAYLSQSKNVRESSQNSIVSHVKESAGFFADPVITNVSLTHELWIHSSNTRDSARIAEFKDKNKTVLSNRIASNDVLNLAPVSFGSQQIDPESREYSDEMTTLTRHLAKYLVSLQAQPQPQGTQPQASGASK